MIQFYLKKARKFSALGSTAKNRAEAIESNTPENEKALRDAGLVERDEISENHPLYLWQEKSAAKECEECIVGVVGGEGESAGDLLIKNDLRGEDSNESIVRRFVFCPYCGKKVA